MLIKNRNGRQHAAEALGFTWATVRRHLKEDGEFAQRVDEAENLLIEQIEGVLIDEALDGNLGAIKMFLHNRAGHRWRDEQVIRKELSGPNGGPIQLVQANVLALREVLTEGTIREAALEMVRELPAHTDVIEAEVVDDDG